MFGIFKLNNHMDPYGRLFCEFRFGGLNIVNFHMDLDDSTGVTLVGILAV